jgi:hypothetical protein
MILFLVFWRCYEKFNVGGDTSLTEVTESELGSSISLDLSDIDMFNSDWVIALS